jgi:hypothetical protein
MLVSAPVCIVFDRNLCSEDKTVVVFLMIIISVGAIIRFKTCKYIFI